MPEYGIQAALVLVMLLSRRWVVLLIHLPVLAYHVRTFALDAYKTDVTEIFRQLPRERRIRIIKLAIYMGGFVFIVYKCALQLYCSVDYVMQSAVLGLLLGSPASCLFCWVPHGYFVPLAGQYLTPSGRLANTQPPRACLMYERAFCAPG